jgi:hypothetical protein
MNICEAITLARKENKAIRQSDWPKERYVYHGMDNLLRWGHNDIEIIPCIALFTANNFELLDSTPYQPEKDDKDYMPKIDGKCFRCDCGGNVFHKPHKGSEIFICNSCGTRYHGEK